MQEKARPAFVFTAPQDDPDISHSAYENDNGIYFLSIHERPPVNGDTAYIVRVFNMSEADPMEQDGTVFIPPYAELACLFTADWVSADPDVNMIEAIEDTTMNWLDTEDIAPEETLALRFTPDTPEGEEVDWPANF